MNITGKITKRWRFISMSGPDAYPVGTIVRGKQHLEGLLMDHFYAYGQNEIIPNEFFKRVRGGDKRRRKNQLTDFH